MDILLKYFPHLNNEQKRQFSMLLPLYSEWNAKINLISRKDIDNIYERHILHSLAIAKIIQFKEGTKVMDIGTGGGFPGIPLAIMYPEVDFHSVDSIGKKLKVVLDVSEKLELSNIRASHQRVEEIEGKYDFFVNRAVANLSKLNSRGHKKVKKENIKEKKNGIISLKGGNLSEEIENFGKKVELYQIKEFFEEAFFETKKVLYAPLT